MYETAKNPHYDHVYAPAATCKKAILSSWHLACCKLAAILASQM